MIALWMAYIGVVTFLVGAGALFLERSLRSLGRPARWIWATALPAAVLAPAWVRVAQAWTLLAPLRSPLAVPTVASPASAPILPGPMLPLPRPLLHALGIGGVSAETLYEWAGPAADRLLLSLWAAASLVVLLVAAGAALRLRAELGRCRPAVVRGRQVMLSGAVGPAVVGIVRPRIVLPRWVLALETGALEMVLRHEDEHRGARDPALLALGLAVAAVLPWNPGVWWMLRRLRLAVEADCDARVLGGGIPHVRYGRMLVTLAERGAGTAAPAAALIERRGSALERRLKMIMAMSGGKRRSLTVVGSGVLLGGLALFLACDTPTPPQVERVDRAGQVQQAGRVEPAGRVGRLGPAATANEAASPGVTVEGQTDGLAMKITGSRGVVSGDTLRVSPPAAIVFERVPGRVRSAVGAEPLVYVDGVPVADPTTALNGLDRDRIERIEVVKGAAAERILGARARSGVIQIFMKHGAPGS